jgi:pimeloyl-ACP methyl ester carboxylesterase
MLAGMIGQQGRRAADGRHRVARTTDASHVTGAWTAAGPLDAPAIVFIHGTRLSRSQWAPQVRRLKDRYRCIAIDLPGHGTRVAEPFTMDEAVATVQAAIEANVPSGHAVLVGLSLGGYVAIEVGAAAPERVSGLVLAGCSAEPVGPAAVGIRLLASVLERVPARPLETANRWYFRARYRRSIVEPLLAGGLGMHGGAEALRALADRSYLDRLSRLWTPVLVVNGALDPVFGPGGEPWAAACRRGRHAVLGRAMHLSNLDRPGPFAELVGRFVDEVELDLRAA